MIYALLRAIAGVALRWYYSGIDADGVERIPRDGPVLVVVNHPNALVDALVVGWVVPRRLLITAKATLFVNPLAARLLRWAGVVPLRRASDERNAAPVLDPARNAESFRAVTGRLASGGAVLIFPEGKSHDEPSLAPLRSGAARMALTAREGGVRGVRIVPVGLTFERKEAPRSRVYARVGEVIDVDAWCATTTGQPAALTAEIDARLRAVTLNFRSADDAARTAALSSVFARLLWPAPMVHESPAPLSRDYATARRVEVALAALPAAPPALQARASTLTERVLAFDRTLAGEGMLLEDIEVDLALAPAVRFSARESLAAVLLAPFAAWGRLNHWLPFHAARAIAMRGVESAADPAMRTIVAGAALVLLFYAAQALLVARLVGWTLAAGYVATLPLAAEASFALESRFARARQRAATFLRLRSDPGLRARLVEELAWLRREATAVERALAGRA